MGGKAAMTLALQKPSLLHRLVVVDIAPVSYPTMRQAKTVATAMKQLPLTGPENVNSRQAADAYLRRFVHDDTIRRFALTNFIGASRGQGPSWRVNLDVMPIPPAMSSVLGMLTAGS